jgi:hypothetical protein
MGVQAFEGTFPAGASVVVRGDFQIPFGDTQIGVVIHSFYQIQMAIPFIPVHLLLLQD